MTTHLSPKTRSFLRFTPIAALALTAVLAAPVRAQQNEIPANIVSL
jgi:hypothetical protein